MVGGAFSFYFDKNAQLFKIGTFPFFERRQQLQPVAFRTDGNGYFCSILCRCNKSFFVRFESAFWKFVSFRCFKNYFFPFRVLDIIRQRIKRQPSGNRKCRYDFGTRDESVRGRIRIISSCEISVVRCDDGIFFAHGNIVPFPLSDTGTAGIGEHQSADIGQRLELAVPFDGSPNLLAAGRDREFRFCLQTFGERLTGNRGGAFNIFIRRICAASDQRYFQFFGIPFFPDGAGKLRNRPGKIRCERTVDMRFKFVKINFHHSVVILSRIRLNFRIRPQMFGDCLCKDSYFFSFCGAQIITHS